MVETSNAGEESQTHSLILAANPSSLLSQKARLCRAFAFQRLVHEFLPHACLAQPQDRLHSRRNVLARNLSASCPLQNNGCYAEQGPLRIHWDAVSEGRRGVSFDEFCDQVRRLPRNQIWRYGQAGDLPGEGEAIDGAALDKLARANARRPVIAYTHKPPTAENLTHLRKAKAQGFTVNLSADNLEEADLLAATGLPTVVILPSDYGRHRHRGLWAEEPSAYTARMAIKPHQTPQGRKIAVCPATYADVTCGQCLVCATDRKGVIVGFPAHGPARHRALDGLSLNGTSTKARPTSTSPSQFLQGLGLIASHCSTTSGEIVAS